MSGRATHDHTKGPAGSKRTTPEFRSWCAMKARCLNPKNCKYPRYGARGICTCSRWLGKNGFLNFLSDMGIKPTVKHTIDRFPNKDGNYEPENCRWATAKQQAENRTPASFNGQKNKTHCPSGHPYAGNNLYITPTGGRKCRKCDQLRQKSVRLLKTKGGVK